MVQNVALFTVGVGALSAAVELAKVSNFVGAAIALVVGVAAVVLYEKLPPTTPPVV